MTHKIEKRSQRDVIESMLVSTAWDTRSRQQKMFILGRARRFKMDVYRLRGIGWNVKPETAKAKLFTWLCATSPEHPE